MTKTEINTNLLNTKEDTNYTLCITTQKDGKELLTTAMFITIAKCGGRLFSFGGGETPNYRSFRTPCARATQKAIEQAHNEAVAYYTEHAAQYLV